MCDIKDYRDSWKTNLSGIRKEEIEQLRKLHLNKDRLAFSVGFMRAELKRINEIIAEIRGRANQ